MAKSGSLNENAPTFKFFNSSWPAQIEPSISMAPKPPDDDSIWALLDRKSAKLFNQRGAARVDTLTLFCTSSGLKILIKFGCPLALNLIRAEATKSIIIRSINQAGGVGALSFSFFRLWLRCVGSVLRFAFSISHPFLLSFRKDASFQCAPDGAPFLSYNHFFFSPPTKTTKYY